MGIAWQLYASIPDAESVQTGPVSCHSGSSCQGFKDRWQCLSPCGLHCPGHAVLHALEGVGPSLKQSEPVTVWLPFVWPHKESAKMAYIDVRQTSWGHGNAGVLVVSHGVFCGGDALAGTSVGCLPQFPWGIFLTPASCSPRMIPEYVSFAEAS
jgi:hypothetical protein